eukprot:m.240289 g.240289  ORF g.240289 m.240289 type:complete len:84 (-) comp23276_c0_seq1:296-547(-)
MNAHLAQSLNFYPSSNRSLFVHQSLSLDNDIFDGENKENIPPFGQHLLAASKRAVSNKSQLPAPKTKTVRRALAPLQCQSSLR